MSRNPFNKQPLAGPQGASAENIDALTDAAMTYAELFVTEYYKAVNTNRNTLATFYLPVHPTGDNAFPSITFNGIPLADGAEMQNFITRQIPRGHLEVDNIDCHVLNPSYQHPRQPPDASKSKTLMSLFIVAGGIYKASHERGAHEEEFHSTITLVPNPDAAPLAVIVNPAGRNTSSNRRRSGLLLATWLARLAMVGYYFQVSNPDSCYD